MGETTTSGTPTLTMDDSIIQYTGQTALKVNIGTIGPVTNSIVYHSRFGVVAQLDATVDLSGGNNIVACNQTAEPGGYGGTVPGINLWNSSYGKATINATGVLLPDSPPSEWECSDGNGSANNCTCLQGSCSGTNVPATDQADAVYSSLNTAATPIDLTNTGVQQLYPTCN